MIKKLILSIFTLIILFSGIQGVHANEIRGLKYDRFQPNYNVIGGPDGGGGGALPNGAQIHTVTTQNANIIRFAVSSFHRMSRHQGHGEIGTASISTLATNAGHQGWSSWTDALANGRRVVFQTFPR